MCALTGMIYTVIVFLLFGTTVLVLKGYLVRFPKLRNTSHWFAEASSVRSLDKPEIKIWRHWRHHYNKTYLTTLRVKYLRILCSAAAGLLVCCPPHYCAREVVVICRRGCENSDKEKTNDSMAKWQLQISGHATYVFQCRGIVLVGTYIILHFTYIHFEPLY